MFVWCVNFHPDRGFWEAKYSMEPSCSCYGELGPEPEWRLPPSAVTRQLLSVCFRVSARVNMTTGARHQMGTWEMYHGNGIVRGHGYRHLPIFPSSFYFGVLKALKKERKCKVCVPSDVVPHDNYMTSNMNNRSAGRPTAYLFSQTAQVYTSSVRCRNSTDEGRVKSVVLYL